MLGSKVAIPATVSAVRITSLMPTSDHLDPAGRACADHVEDRHRDDDPGGENVDQDAVSRDIEEQALGISAESSRHHRDGDEKREHVDQREGAGDRLREGRVEVAESAVLRGVARAEPRERIA